MKKLLVSAAVAAIVVTTPTAAFAQVRDRQQGQDQRVDRVKARCLAQIQRRQSALTEMDNRLDQARALTDAHRAALKRIDTQSSDGLSSLANEIQAEDNIAELRAECRRIVEDFRVFALVRPRARVVLASDRELAAVDKLHNVQARLQSAIDKAKADGRDTSAAEGDLAAMKTAVDAAASKAGAVYDDVIGLSPSDFNANPNVLEPSVSSVKAGRDDLKTAVSDAKAARDALKSSTTTSAA
jgi:hypothetical protein